jgi:hypothetical protein
MLSAVSADENNGESSFSASAGKFCMVFLDS